MKKLLLSSLLWVQVAIAAPKAVVFDFGGVLTELTDKTVVIQFIQESLSLSSEEFDKAYQEKKKSNLSDEQFWLSYAKEHKIKVSKSWSDDFKKAIEKSIGASPKMYALVEALKKEGQTVALLSNIDDRYAQLIDSYHLYDNFEPCLLSCQMGVKKPDAEAYKILLENLKLPASDVVFIDDNRANVDAAKTLGIDAILFESHEKLSEELKAKGLLSNYE